MKKVLISIAVVLSLSFSAFAATEALEWRIAYLQEHIKNLQSEFQLTQTELQKALLEKKTEDEAAAKKVEETKKSQKK